MQLGVWNMNRPLAMLGAAGSPGGFSGLDWRTADLRTVALSFSPQIAMARSMGRKFAPFVQNIVAQFTNATDTIGPFSLGSNVGGTQNNSESRLSMISVVDQIVLHVDAPNLNLGNALKPFIDWFFARQTGVQATLIVDGSPRFVVSPDFTPIDTLVSMITEMWPCGWVLGYTQQPKMQFTTSITLPTTPVTFTITFRMWQPDNASGMIGLTDSSALGYLVGKGILSDADASNYIGSGS
jgi:hypothetical protein